MSQKIVIISIACSLLLLTSCAAGSTEYTETQAGFFSGVWHGWIAPLAILWHFIVDSDVRIYETNNTGIFYDVGFYIAVISGFGGLSLTRTKKTKKDRKSK